MREIAILLPGPRREPVGGYKVLYQYGDYLSTVGWSITFMYLTDDFVCNSRFDGLKGIAKAFIIAHTEFYKWYDFRSTQITHKVISDLKKIKAEQYDVIICSAVETFIYVKEFTNIENKKLAYFVQGYEVWNIGKLKLEETLSYSDVDYITISDDLAKRIAQAGGKQIIMLYNGIDKNDFFINKKWLEREENSFLFLYHPGEHKGCDVLLEAICKVKSENNNFKFSCFSAYPKPQNFPEFIDYTYRPTIPQLNELYNDHRFFICSSVHEGFGLTPAEAAFAGVIIITTRNGGVEQYVTDMETGFVLEQRTCDAFARKIKEVAAKGDALYEFSIISNEKIRKQLDLQKNFIRLDEYLTEKCKLL